jgi:ABC-type uncharacterized transport system permease subunit
MDLSAISPTLLVASLMVASTPILLASIGELVVEKSGVLNLGVEGMMIVGAICGFAAAVLTGSPMIGFLCAALGGAAISLIFAVLTQYFLSNQVATGLALTLFGLGLSALLGQSYVGIKPPTTYKLDLPLISDIPILGPILFSHDFTVYAALSLVAGVWWFLKYTRSGLILRAVGESHDAAHALGYKVVRVRVMSIMFGGAGLPWLLLFLQVGNLNGYYWARIFLVGLQYFNSTFKRQVCQFQLSICPCHRI